MRHVGLLWAFLKAKHSDFERSAKPRQPLLLVVVTAADTDGDGDDDSACVWATWMVDLEASVCSLFAGAPMAKLRKTSMVAHSMCVVFFFVALFICRGSRIS